MRIPRGFGIGRFDRVGFRVRGFDGLRFLGGGGELLGGFGFAGGGFVPGGGAWFGDEVSFSGGLPVDRVDVETGPGCPGSA